MKSAHVVFKGGIPFSPEFDDIYFNADDPIGQSEYVFNSIFDEIWSKKDEFNILETGFGAGLNFLCAFKRFKNSDKFLNFVSIEANPISKEDLAKIYANFSELADVSNELLSAYPPLIRGFHRLNLAPNVTLTLCFGDAAEVLGELSFIADAVFMDGFAPSKNEAMWSEDVCAKIANLCAPGAAVCTYSASGALKRALQNSGFEVNSLKGYGKKREMLRAKFAGEPSAEKEIWFSRFDRSRAVSSKPKTALIIGSGVAGCVCAFKLHERGLDVAIAEKRGDIALNGSGNHCGILMPLITKPAVNLGRMHMNAFLQAARFYERNLSAEQIEFCGAKDYAYEPKTLERFLEWSEFDADNGVFELNFDDEPYASAFIFRGAKARPRKMCKAASAGIKTLLNCEFTGFETLEGGAVRAHFKDGRSIDADVLVLALGSESMELLADHDIRLSSVRGQVTHIAPAVTACAPFSAKGYVCPPTEGVQVIGATYDRNLFLDEPRASDDEKNLADVAEFLGGEFGEEPTNLADAWEANSTFRGAISSLDRDDGENMGYLGASRQGANLSKSKEKLHAAPTDREIVCKFNNKCESLADFANGEHLHKSKIFSKNSESFGSKNEQVRLVAAGRLVFFAGKSAAEKFESAQASCANFEDDRNKNTDKNGLNAPNLTQSAVLKSNSDGFDILQNFLDSVKFADSRNLEKINDSVTNLQALANTQTYAVKADRGSDLTSAASSYDGLAKSLNSANLKDKCGRLDLANLINSGEKIKSPSAANLDSPNLKIQNEHEKSPNAAQTEIFGGFCEFGFEGNAAGMQNCVADESANSSGNAAEANSEEKSELLSSPNLAISQEPVGRSNLLNFSKNSDVDGLTGAFGTHNTLNLTESKSSPKSVSENELKVATKIQPNIRIIGSKVGYRSYSGDRFPLIGRLYDEDYYKQAYKSLLWTKNGANPPPKYVSNVYVSTAHGSRGLCTAVLGAELICDLVFDRPLCIEKSLFDELHLARFLIRKLKKGLK